MTKEDQLVEIYAKVDEIESTLATIAAAANNEYDPPELKDIQNALIVTLDYIKQLKQDVYRYKDEQQN